MRPATRIAARLVVFALVALQTLALGATLALAQPYPSKPIRLVVPFAPGAIVDLAARVAAERIGSATGQPVVIENRPGASGNTGIAQVLQSRPDGYVLGLTSDSILAINPHIYASMPFDPLNDVTPIGMIGAATQILIVNPKLPASNLREFIALARASAGKLTYGSAGAGSNLHLGAHVFSSMAGITLTHVPYKGAAPATIDLLAGRIDLMSATLASVIQHVRVGALRVLLVGGTERMKALPEVPSADEAGLPGYKSTIWFGVIAPRGVPAEVVDILNTHLRAIPQDAAARKRLDDAFIDPMPLTPGEFAGLIRADWQRWQPIVKATGVKLD